MYGEKMESSNKLKLVVGVDILPGYSVQSSSKQPHYAAVFLKGDEVIQSYEDISLSRLIRLIWEHRPELIAIDNVFELAQDTSGLQQLIRILPPGVKIVQVTGWGPEAVNIRTVAKNLGIDARGKLTPLKTAYLAAVIASRGGGVIVKLVEEKTRIVISRGRSVSHGGMSYERYKRSVRAGILNITREVKKILDSNGFDYDLVFRKGKGGLEKSVFIVYAPREKLYGLIKPIKTKSVKLTIKPIYRDKIVFEPMEKPRKTRGLILGVDPGIYTGIAVLDLNGEPLLLYSSKNLDRSDITTMVLPLGEVVIVATDTSDPPELVKKLSTTLNAILYTPQRDLSTEEKQEVVNKLKSRYPWLEVQDTHERDALAAAYRAYTSIRDKLAKIDSRIGEIGVDIDRERVRINVLKGKSFAGALEEELEKLLENFVLSSNSETKEQPKEEDTELIDKLRERIKKLKYRVSYLESIVRELTRRLEEKESIIAELKMNLKLAKIGDQGSSRSERKLYMLEQENQYLRKLVEEREKEINRLNHRIKELEGSLSLVLSGDYVALPRIRNLCLSEVKKVLDEVAHNAIFVDEVYPIDVEAIELLKDREVGIVSRRDYGELFKDLRVPLVNDDNVVLIGEYAILHRKVLDVIREQWKTIKELDGMDEYNRIVNLIREYQESRRRRHGKNTGTSRG